LITIYAHSIPCDALNAVILLMYQDDLSYKPFTVKRHEPFMI